MSPIEFSSSRAAPIQFFALTVLMSVGFAGVVAAQEQPAAAPPAAEPPAAEQPAEKQPPATAEDFDGIYAEWNKLNGRLDDIIQEYRAAGSVQRQKLVKEYEDLVTQMRTLLPRLRASSIAAYEAAPNEDDRVTNTIVGLVANDVRQDQYDGAVKLAQLLVDNKCDQPTLHTFLGIAAYCLDDFAAAETHLNQAQAAGVMTSTAEQCLSDLNKAKAAWAVEQGIREEEAKDDDLPRVKLQTSKGDIVIELFENEAPKAVGNFVSLVEKQYYDGLIFHRVLPGFMAQGGCPQGTGTGGPGYEIPCECHQENHRKHFRGSLSMAHAGRDTGGSQFFLTFKRTPHLDGLHTVFGRVIEGTDVLAKIQRRDPSQGGPLPTPDKIVKAEVVRKREHEYAPTKVKKPE